MKANNRNKEQSKLGCGKLFLISCAVLVVVVLVNAIINGGSIHAENWVMNVLLSIGMIVIIAKISS